MENGDKYLPELLAEKDSLDSSFTHAMKLLNAGKVDSLFNSGWGVKLGGDNVRDKEPKTHFLQRGRRCPVRRSAYGSVAR